MASKKTTDAASHLGKLRWKGKTKQEKAAFMKEVRTHRSNASAGRQGGRKPSPDRCYCGENSWKRAAARAFGCCKKAGKYPTGKMSLEERKESKKKIA